jgi:hypothetical protein
VKITESTVYRVEFPPVEGLALIFEVPAPSVTEAQIRLKRALENAAAALQAAIYHRDEAARYGNGGTEQR